MVDGAAENGDLCYGQRLQGPRTAKPLPSAPAHWYTGVGDSQLLVPAGGDRSCCLGRRDLCLHSDSA